MYEFIQGNVVELSPAYAVVENGGIGYFLSITVNSYSQLAVNTKCKLLLHQIIREDAHQLFGFVEASERELFRLLISVLGIGANTARIILSSLTPEELSTAISTENVRLLQGVKGIGAKTAQRMIIDLKDKVTKVQIEHKISAGPDNTMRNEALSALVMLGFARNQVQKVLEQISKENKNLSVEEIVKQALKVL